MFCKFCGSKIDENSIYCSSCGKQLTPEENNFSSKDFVVDAKIENQDEIIIEQPKKDVNRPPKSVSFFGAIKNYYTNYTNFSGRAVKTEYWYIWLYNIIVSVVLLILSAPNMVSFAWSVIHLIPGVALNVRRLHDTGRSATSLWFLLIPFAGPFILLYFCSCDSDYDNQYGLSPYITISNNQNQEGFEGYSAVSKRASHVWFCECGAKISISPCPFCGKEHIITVETEDDLKKYIAEQLTDQSLPTQTLDFYKKYLECIYAEVGPNTISTLKFIFASCYDYVNNDIAKAMLDVCNRKIDILGLKRCMGCGEILSADTLSCDCGYIFE